MAHHRKNLWNASPMLSIPMKEHIKEVQEEKRKVFLYTDGSYHSKLKIGCAAFVVVHKGRIKKKNFSVLNRADGVTEVELIAIRNGLDYISKRYGNVPVVLHTDSKTSIRFIESNDGPKKKNRAICRRLTSQINEIKLNVDYQWIKGHPVGIHLTKHHHYQQMCDKMATTEMRKRAEEIKTEHNIQYFRKGCTYETAPRTDS